ncbi:TCF3 fusion partner [Rhineura floridana]|uniref:TCF3 fusion partner n=1 Tax=Rhineura floridana TaxID=261503 RepID=UPI002AC88452|nr:TCF3 fusion partner [Rhineura floridana]XP_061443991.1 TCF3 fusion partner [Rhineura floridana]XP_061443993.1 TCF3 fusion partner [Rhineura floridana]XP_061443994.1 TCF3 fusion partner [Rhineura floridana]
MAGVGFEEFSVPPGSELALPPLFGGNILESELETEVEFADGGIAEEEEEEGALRQQEMTRRKCQALARRCKELEQVNERMLNRLLQVQRITLRLKQERRFLMRVLDSYGDDYMQGHLDVILEDEGSHSTDAPAPGNTENEPPGKETPRHLSGPLPTPEAENLSPTEGPTSKKRRCHMREEKEARQRRAAQTLLPMEEFPVQIKSEEDFQCEQEDVLTPAWQQSSPQDKLLHYSKFSSPGACSDFD